MGRVEWRVLMSESTVITFFSIKNARCHIASLRFPSASRRPTDVHKHLRGGIELQIDGPCADDEHSGKPVLTESIISDFPWES